MFVLLCVSAFLNDLLTFVGIISSDVSRSSCTVSFTPCCPIFCHSYLNVFFQGRSCPLLEMFVINQSTGSWPWFMWRPLLLSLSIIPRMHVLKKDCINCLTACFSKESHFLFQDNLGNGFLISWHMVILYLGIVYITYSKSSEAALAIEEMNGKPLANHPKPIKVGISTWFLPKH